MDTIYHTICKQINIDQDRKDATDLYNHLRKTINSGLKKQPFLAELFSHDKLCGSYADNLKITSPNEFDLVLRLRLPEEHLINISPDPVKKGSVFIDLTEVLRHLENDRSIKKQKFYNVLITIVNSDNFVLENKLQNCIRSCMANVLNSIDKTLTFKNEKFKLTYRICGPAHTIYVQNVKEDKPVFSVDFVPAFVFRSEKSISLRQITSFFWEAIPRPLKEPYQMDNISFRTSYADSERDLMRGKYQLKNALRLMKKFRDLKPHMVHLKSYYIKTIFLWINEEVEEEFWEKPITHIMSVVFEKIEYALEKRELHFFWDKDLNMLATLKPTQIKQMFYEVRSARMTLRLPLSKKNVLNLFLSPEEQSRVTKNDMTILTDCINELKPKTNEYLKTIYLNYFFFSLYGIVLCFQIYRVFY